MNGRFQLNGKFLAAPPTGVHRVARELANALADLIAEGHPAARGLALEALVPADGLARAAALRMPVRQVGPLRHIAWEQITLPLRHRRIPVAGGAGQGGTLLNLCNIGPVLSPDCVTMIHDVQVLLSPQSYSRGFRTWYRAVQPAIARRHRLLLTVSDYSKAQIVAAGLAPAERIAVIPNGVDHALAATSDGSVVERLGLARGRYVLGLANVQAHKNVAVLLRAFAAPALSGLQLVLFGGAAADDFARAGHAIPPNVRFAGRVSDGQLRGLVEQALCLAFPSTTEGFGLPPLEAMLLGCPAVVAPCGALPEVCGDAALTALPHDTAAWIAALAELAANPDLHAACAVAGRVQAAQFTWRRSAIALADVLADLASRR